MAFFRQYLNLIMPCSINFQKLMERLCWTQRFVPQFWGDLGWHGRLYPSFGEMRFGVYMESALCAHLMPQAQSKSAVHLSSDVF